MPRPECEIDMAAPARLPQLSPELFLTDGGLETTLIFHEGFDLPDFAAFTLLDSVAGRLALERYYVAYLAIAARHGTGLVLETPTWRASADWGKRLGYSAAALRAVNIAAVEQLRALRDSHAQGQPSVVISGNLGPRGDGYSPTTVMTPEESAAYHSEQIRALADGGAELITALTITHVGEAIGIVRESVEHGMPIVISFTVETDGTLPSGQPLEAAIAELDAATAAGAAYLMVNCAHPTHFADVLEPHSSAFERIRGIRGNASMLSHAELDEADELDAGDPVALATHYRDLLAMLPNLSILGGCCGTDDRHIDAIAAACAPLLPR